MIIRTEETRTSTRVQYTLADPAAPSVSAAAEAGMVTLAFAGSPIVTMPAAWLPAFAELAAAFVADSDPEGATP